MEEKIIQSTVNKCQNCGGNLIFNPATKSLKCENCDTEYLINEMKDFDKHSINETKANTSEYKNWEQENRIFKCQNCGSSVILNSLEVAKTCPYCNTPFVTESNELPDLKPDSIIPFAFDEETASQKFVDNVKKKFYANGTFKKKMPANCISGTYIPTFVFDAKSHSKYSGCLEEERSTPDGIKRFPLYVEGVIDVVHNNVVIETSSKINQNELNGILPYNYSALVKYQNGYIRGYTVEYYQDALNTCKESAHKIFRKQIEKAILNRYPQASRIKSLSFTPTLSDETYHYQLIPIYKFTYNYKDKNYITYMNGQTGKIDNNIPKSIPKIIATILLAIGLFALIPLLIFLFY